MKGAVLSQSQSHSAVVAGRLEPGDLISPRELRSLAGAVRLPAEHGLTHLQLRRFAGCPVCNLHLRSLTARRDEIAGAGISELVVFHSSADELSRYQPEIPFTVVPDPDRTLYRDFGAQRSLRAVLDPRLWLRAPRILAGVFRGLRQGQLAPRLRPRGGQLGLPADILLNSDGRVVAAKYGAHAYDQWSVDELLVQARELNSSAA